MQLKAETVSFRYGRQHPWVLRDKSFSISGGERIAIVAPSGYGKSTLAMILAGHKKPVSGKVLLDGVPLPLPEKGVCPVQLIFQHPEKAINPRWRLHRVLEESGNLREDVLESFGIEKAWLDRFPIELSGGELQRFCVARALMSSAEFLICDEISTMLDVITQAQIWNKIIDETKQRGMGLIVVTHNMELAKRVAGSIFDMTKD